MDALLREPGKTKSIARLMAAEHAKLHEVHIGGNAPRRVDGPGIPCILKSQTEKFGGQIDIMKATLGSRHSDISTKLASLREDDVLCHGDFHPGNLLLENGRCVLIDWMNCYRGSQVSDVARTYVTLLAPNAPEGVPPIFSAAVPFLKRLTARTYLREYLKLTSIDISELAAWIEVIAAARIIDEIEGEKEWLLEIVRGKRRLPVPRG